MNSIKQEAISRILLPTFAQAYSSERNKFIVWEFPQSAISEDPLNALKQLIKKYSAWLYPTIIKYISPTYVHDFVGEFLDDRAAQEHITLNLGAGTIKYPHVIAVDGTAYRDIDVVCNLETLPFQDNSVDSIISNAVLEHVPNPATHIEEFWRVLKPGGEVLCFMPFMQPFHSSPYDYQRFTQQGLQEAFKDFELLHIKVGAGPTSSMLWVLQEWLAMVLSFGNMKLYRLLQVALLCLFPLKYLDILLEKHPAASTLASGFIIRVKKPLTEDQEMPCDTPKT